MAGQPSLNPNRSQRRASTCSQRTARSIKMPIAEWKRARGKPMKASFYGKLLWHKSHRKLPTLAAVVHLAPTTGLTDWHQPPRESAAITHLSLMKKGLWWGKWQRRLKDQPLVWPGSAPPAAMNGVGAQMNGCQLRVQHRHDQAG